MIGRQVLKKTLKNFGFSHKCGIIMPVSSLPSPYGIGGFGKGAFDFIDFLAATGQKCWQVLPLNPTSYGDSPYQSPATLAGNPYFIDLPLLKSEGLLTAEELKAIRHNSLRVDYGFLFETRYSVLRIAHSRFSPDSAYKAFCKREKAWLDDYALFMALKCRYGHAPWTEWGAEHRDYLSAVRFVKEYKAEMDFWRFVQYKFHSQWQAVRDYAHGKGIAIIGDMPIYIAYDSMDLWRTPGQFQLDDKLKLTVVAGCPPDGFSPDGQRWGNPLYDWNVMERDGFTWWIQRIKRCFALYDIMRIDHFRGFAGYFAIPAEDENARRGTWCPAKGRALFDKLARLMPKAKIIAEDLGFITEDVRELLAHTGFPGMKDMQFAFFDDDSEFLPRAYTTDNCVVYAASQDTDRLKSWYKGLEGETLVRFNRECPRVKWQSGVYRVIEFCMRSRANLCMVPLQDYLELDNARGRMNIPAVADGNWAWRVSPRYATAALKARVLDMAVRTGRNTKLTTKNRTDKLI